MEVSLWGGYSFAPSFRVGAFTGLDSDLVKLTTYCDSSESSGLVPAFEIRIRPQHFIFFYFHCNQVFKKVAAISAHSRARVAGGFCPRNNASFSVHCAELPSCALE